MYLTKTLKGNLYGKDVLALCKKKGWLNLATKKDRDFLQGLVLVNPKHVSYYGKPKKDTMRNVEDVARYISKFTFRGYNVSFVKAVSVELECIVH